MDQLLLSWGLPSVYVSAFTDEDWTVESLPLISDESIHRLIPKEGPRTVFYHHFNSFKNSKNQNRSSDEDSSDESDVPLSRRSPRRRLNNAQLQLLLNEPDINGMHKNLKGTFPGIIVLSHYKANAHLDNYTRDLLCAQILHKELENDFDKKLVRDNFDALADSIVEIFSTESKATWYDVVKKGKATSVQGRLRFKYYALRRVLINASLISKRDVEDFMLEDDEFDDLGEDADDESFMWLLSNDMPWPEVTVKWEETSQRRQKHLNSCSKIFEYVQKFPCLTSPSGWKLIASDGIKKQPNLDVSLRDLWVEYSPFLLTVLRQGSPKFLKGRKYTSLSTEQQFVHIFLELVALFKVRTLPKSPEAGKREKSWRPSRSEVQDGLCLHVTSVPEIQERINLRKTVLLKYKYALQPTAVFLGPLGNIRQCFIVLDNQRWEVDNAFQAVEGIFQLSFGLHSQYAVEARHIWLFLQRTLYNITTPEDFSRDSGLRSFLSGRLKDYELFQKK